MAGQDIGRAEQPRVNPLAQIASEFIQAENIKTAQRQQREQQEQDRWQNNPVAMIKGQIYKKAYQQGEQALSPKEKKWYDTFRQQDLGGTQQQQQQQELYESIRGMDVLGASDQDIAGLKQQYPQYVKQIEDIFDVSSADIRSKAMVESQERMRQKQALNEIQDLGLTNISESELSVLSPFAQSYVRQRATPNMVDGQEVYDLEPLTTMREKEQLKKEVKREAEAYEELEAVDVITSDVDRLLDIYNQIPLSVTGPLQGRTSGAIAKLTQTVPEIALYEDLKQSILSNVARKLGGEKGVLTDQDIARIEGFFPKLTDTPETAARKQQFIKDFIQERVAMQQRKMGQDTVDTEKQRLYKQFGLDV